MSVQNFTFDAKRAVIAFGVEIALAFMVCWVYAMATSQSVSKVLVSLGVVLAFVAVIGAVVSGSSRRQISPS